MASFSVSLAFLYAHSRQGSGSITKRKILEPKCGIEHHVEYNSNELLVGLPKYSILLQLSCSSGTKLLSRLDCLSSKSWFIVQCLI